VRASKLKGTVIDLGAGAIEDENNIKVLKKNSFIVYLKREKEDILKSLDTSNRPMFSKTSFDDLVNRRLPLYELHSDFVLNIESISKSYEKLIERMRKL
jgi:shikimate kinase